MKPPDTSLGTLSVIGAKVGVLHDHATQLPAIEVELLVKDANHGGLTRVKSRTAITREELRDPALFRDVLRSCVVRAFEHEVDEWLRVDGELVTDPHPSY